jgi:glyoxylase-like metal-dependent hydrolase (beta-lactamase superfamily II)
MTSAISLLAEAGLKPSSYFRPFGIDDAEIYGVPDTAACGDHVIAERAFLASADAQNCRAGAIVERVGLQLHAHTLEYFEGVAQQEVFGLGVDGGALPLVGDPGPSDFQAMVHALDAGIARGTNYAAAGFLEQRKRQGGSGGLLLERGLDIGAHLLRRAHRSRNPLPEVVFESHFSQPGSMFPGEWFQAYVPACQNHGRNHHLLGHIRKYSASDWPLEKALRFRRKSSLPGRFGTQAILIATMSDITILDTNWVGRPHSVAAALLESGGHRAIIDPGPESTYTTLRERLHSRGLSVAQLDAILLTHIHLDHAGASGSLVGDNPRLVVYVHRLGAPHIIDPAKLLASAARLWPDTLHQLFGETLPVPKENLRILEGGETLTLGTRKLEVAYTPGHASHHVSYFDAAESVAFVGDTTGIRIDNGPYILPATPPPDISLEIWENSFAAILAWRPSRLFLTHFGYAEKPAEHIAEFRRRLHRWRELAAEILRSAPSEAEAKKTFVARAQAEMQERLGTEEADHHAFTAGLDLSFLGLARYLRKRAEATA